MAQCSLGARGIDWFDRVATLKIKLFLRSLWIQGLINYPRMQGNGYRYMSNKKSARPFFNTHPWFAAAFAEMVRNEVAKGRNENEIRLVWMGTFGALGDGLFWSFLRPLAIVLSMVVLVLDVRYFWVLPVVFWLFSMSVRLWLQQVASGGEAAMVRFLRDMRLREWMDRGRKFTFVVVGLASGAAWSMLWTLDRSRDSLGMQAWLVILAMSMMISAGVTLTRITLPIRTILALGTIFVTFFVWIIS